MQTKELYLPLRLKYKKGMYFNQLMLLKRIEMQLSDLKALIILYSTVQYYN